MHSCGLNTSHYYFRMDIGGQHSLELRIRGSGVQIPQGAPNLQVVELSARSLRERNFASGAM